MCSGKNTGRVYKVCSISIMLFFSSEALASGQRSFASFKNETATVSKIIKCPAPKLTKTSGFSDLWGCIYPGAEVVKVFVNAGSNNVDTKNIKFIWNDWTKDIGYGLHKDKVIAGEWVKALATHYAPEDVQAVLAAFKGEEAQSFSADGVTLRYSYLNGPAIDERMIVITDN